MARGKKAYAAAGQPEVGVDLDHCSTSWTSPSETNIQSISISVRLVQVSRGEILPFFLDGQTCILSVTVCGVWAFCANYMSVCDSHTYTHTCMSYSPRSFFMGWYLDLSNAIVMMLREEGELKDGCFARYHPVVFA